MLFKKKYSNILIRHFYPSLKMLKKIIDNCPDNLWNKINGGFPFWQQVYHTIEGLDYWFNENGEYRFYDFKKKVSSDLNINTEDYLTKCEIKIYLNFVLKRIKIFLKKIDDKKILSRSVINNKFRIMDIILIQIRHLQYHVGHCNSILRTNKIKAAKWQGYGE